jgi:hypothetical protein
MRAYIKTNRVEKYNLKYAPGDAYGPSRLPISPQSARLIYIKKTLGSRDMT